MDGSIEGILSTPGIFADHFWHSNSFVKVFLLFQVAFISVMLRIRKIYPKFIKNLISEALSFWWYLQKPFKAMRQRKLDERVLTGALLFGARERERERRVFGSAISSALCAHNKCIHKHLETLFSLFFFLKFVLNLKILLFQTKWCKFY